MAEPLTKNISICNESHLIQQCTSSSFKFLYKTMFLRKITSLIFSAMLVFCLLTIILCASESNELNNALHRTRRQLLFPNSTLLQLNIGVGTPSPVKHVNVNWAIQTNFQLPWNRSQIPVDILEANSGYDGDSRKMRETSDNSDIERKGQMTDTRYKDEESKLYHFYKYIEDVLSSFGHNGTSCVLTALCQLGSQPLHSDDEEDLLHEIASFVLNPQNDIEDEVSKGSEMYPYIEAHNIGRKSQGCAGVYETCTLSLLDMFTKLHDNS